jgi:hypothetical protein
MPRLLSLALAALLALGLTAFVPVAAASADTEREKTGRCSGAATWKLEVDKEEGRIEADFDVNSSSRAGVPWRVRMWDNGTRFFNQLRFTNGFGNFEAEGHTFRSHAMDDADLRTALSAIEPRGRELLRRCLIADQPDRTRPRSGYSMRGRSTRHGWRS